MLCYNDVSRYRPVELKKGGRRFLSIPGGTRAVCLVSNTLDIISHSSAQTQRLGVRLGELLQGGELILLNGSLGTGKTTFTQGLAQGLGIDRKSTRLNSSHVRISYAVFCLKKKKK